MGCLQSETPRERERELESTLLYITTDLSEYSGKCEDSWLGMNLLQCKEGGHRLRKKAVNSSSCCGQPKHEHHRKIWEVGAGVCATREQQLSSNAQGGVHVAVHSNAIIIITAK